MPAQKFDVKGRLAGITQMVLLKLTHEDFATL